jgi:O-antigen ligase
MSTAKALPFGAAALALACNARSMFGLTALSAIAQLITKPGRRISTGALLRYVGIVAVGAIVVVSLYSYAAETGRLGAEARAKYFAQSESEIGLLGGRKEFLASSQAIEDSPLIGHGSWAKDVHYIYVMERRMRALGISVHRSPSAEPLIPSHSHILGAWVEAGLAGAVFWSFVLWLTMRAFASVLRHPPPEIGLICFFLSGLAWDLVFSPFGLDRRLTDAALICIVVATLGRQLGGQRRRAASGPAGVRRLGGRARFQPGSAARFPQGPRASQ